MVLLISEEKDQSTHEVIDWIKRFGKDYTRINPTDKLLGVEIREEELVSFSTQAGTIYLDEVDSVWYRRGFFNFQGLGIPLKDLPFAEALQRYERKEQVILNDFLFRSLRKKRNLGNFHNTDVNKLANLKLARSVGLNVPDTLITSSKAALRDFLEKHTYIITKSIGEVVFGIEEGHKLASYTARIQDLDEFDETFFPSLFQEEIPKKYELRVFYLRGQFYSMAIFSQHDSQTKLDFRNYNHEVPNRVAPCNIPNEVEEKLDQFMQKAKYDTGSIDLILSPEDTYYFLEINPVGQFGMVSYPCNYGLEKRIAEYLCFLS